MNLSIKNKITHANDISKARAVKFVIVIGIVSLFADMTYEGARSITGPYLALLGANALTVGFVAGFGELVGYGLRLLSGYLADRTTKYWAITIIGYLCNLVAVPLLALANHWWMAATLMIIERMGKAIRTPARDAMLSHASQRIGMGWGFGLHEALDQTGAMLGPLIVASLLYFKIGYSQSFAVLGIPAVIALTILLLARWFYPHPQALETSQPVPNAESIHSKTFWLYVFAASLIAAGFADFPLMAYHFEKTAILPNVWIPLLYAIAMGISGLSAPIFGRLYDRYGFIILVIVAVLSCGFAPFVFLGGFKLIGIGVILWSVGMGAQESLMRAVIAQLVPMDKRSTAYGIFNAGYGICWFLGSVLMGLLYDISIPLLVVFSVLIQLIAIPFLGSVMKRL